MTAPFAKKITTLALGGLFTAALFGCAGEPAEEKKDDKAEDGGEKADGEKADGGEKADDGEKADGGAADGAQANADAGAAPTPPAGAGDAGAAPPAEPAAPEHEATGDEPVVLSAVEVEKKTGFGDADGRHQLKISPKIKVQKEMPDDAGIHVKAMCDHGGETVVDVLRVGFSSDLKKMKVDDEKRMEATAFWMGGLKDAPSKCEMKFDFTTKDDTVHLADYCWDGSAVNKGKCEGLKRNTGGTGDVVPFMVTVEPGVQKSWQEGQPDKNYAQVRWMARVNKEMDRWPTTYLKTACKVGERTYTEVIAQWQTVSPFKLAAGEVVPMSWAAHRINGIPAEPEQCEVTVLLDGGWKKPDSELGRFCYKKGAAVADGKCDPAAAAPPAAAAVAADSIKIEEAQFTTEPDYKDKAKKRVRFSFIAKLDKPVEKGTYLNAEAKCEGKEDKPFLSGSPDYSRVEPGQSVLVTASGFGKEPLDADPKKCELTITASKGMDKVEVGKVCITGGTEAKDGGC